MGSLSVIIAKRPHFTIVIWWIYNLQKQTLERRRKNHCAKQKLQALNVPNLRIILIFNREKLRVHQWKVWAQLVLPSHASCNYIHYYYYYWSLLHSAIIYMYVVPFTLQALLSGTLPPNSAVIGYIIKVHSLSQGICLPKLPLKSQAVSILHP